MITDQSPDAEKQELEFLRKAIEQLEIQLDSNPTYSRLAALRKMVVEITAVAEELDAGSSDTAEILAVAEAHLNEVKNYVPAAEILKVIEGRGLKVGGKNPAGNLSAKLFNSEKFVSDRGRGWTLKEFEGANSMAA